MAFAFTVYPGNNVENLYLWGTLDGLAYSLNSPVWLSAGAGKLEGYAASSVQSVCKAFAPTASAFLKPVVSVSPQQTEITLFAPTASAFLKPVVSVSPQQTEITLFAPGAGATLKPVESTSRDGFEIKCHLIKAEDFFKPVISASGATAETEVYWGLIFKDIVSISPSRGTTFLIFKGWGWIQKEIDPGFNWISWQV